MSNNKKIIENIFSLSVAEFASKGLQAVIYLYLARVLGAEGLGSLGFAQSFTAYFILFVKIGFDTVGTRIIAKNPNKIQQTVNHIFSIRTILAFTVFSALVITVYFITDLISLQKFSDTDKLIIIIAGLNIFSFAYLLNWLYIGLERMKVIAIRTVMIGITNIAGILFFVKNSDDVLIAMIIMSASNLITSVYLYIYYKKEFGNAKWQYDKVEWKTLTKASFSIGLTFLIITIYNNLDVTMIRFIKGKSETGIYEAAHRIMLLTLVISSVFQNAFFPQIAKLKGIDLDIILERYSRVLFFVGTALGFSFFVFGDYLPLILTNEFADSVNVLKIMSLTVILMFVNITFFVPLIGWGYENKIFWGNLSGLVFNVILNIILIPHYGAEGAAVATISTEFGVIIYTSYLFYKVRKRIYLKSFIRSFIVAGLSVLPGIYFIQIQLNPILSILFCIILLILFTFAFRIITIHELKAIFKR